jgi:uncharacterized protein (TIGR02453 family)
MHFNRFNKLLMKIKPILEFLTLIKQNNNRDWMEAHKSQYLESRLEFENIINEVVVKISAFDPSIVGVLPKECIFRLNRDIRFSKDKSPYKTHFGAYIAEGGRKSQKAGYYFHLEPGSSLLAGGMYMPSSDALKKIRQEVDYNPTELQNILSDRTFKKYFDNVQGEQLKTVPKGYSPDHPNIQLLKFKSFTVGHSVTDEETLSPTFLDKAVEVFKTMHPFNRFLNVAVS